MSNGMTVSVHLDGQGAVIDGPIRINETEQSLVVVILPVKGNEVSITATNPNALEALADVIRSAATKLRVFQAEEKQRRAGEPRAEIIDIGAVARRKAEEPDNVA